MEPKTNQPQGEELKFLPVTPQLEIPREVSGTEEVKRI
jgi:hypothetical protein